ncbi:TetR/AcrR family transcriptional regulator [Pseudophaeobacter sp. C1-32P7]|uniref:TetR/AcrR family transcriptional regulator n=1 Tax=Pseudophaeobacter sp. C1-32P7 TaxID=3098142 RepID=UPI0034D3CB6F|tara:strand:- start:101 stop:685 length:585 start_codon:yes stop_codon:yes gene_type:complete
MPHKNTSDQILETARDLLASEGLAAVSFDAIARRLGCTKQAVLYWYPSKHNLLAAMFLPWLEAEAETAIQSVSGTTRRDEAVEAFVRAIAGFHFEDLERFRMMYLLPQTLKQSAKASHGAALLDRIHPVTDRMYGALADRLDGNAKDVRQEALAIHSAVLGLLLMFGLADSVRDPLKHNASEMVSALIASLRST